MQSQTATVPTLEETQMVAKVPNYEQLKSALVSAVVADSTGFNLNMWATIVDRDGVVCAVTFLVQTEDLNGHAVVSFQRKSQYCKCI